MEKKYLTPQIKVVNLDFEATILQASLGGEDNPIHGGGSGVDGPIE